MQLFQIIWNPGCHYTVYFVMSLEQKPAKNTITERFSSHIRGFRRCCALSDRNLLENACARFHYRLRSDTVNCATVYSMTLHYTAEYRLIQHRHNGTYAFRFLKQCY
jgi:hypothetical protein